jgi:hypothetical protein
MLDFKTRIKSYLQRVKNKFWHVQIHPTNIIFKVLSEFEVKLAYKNDFEHFFKKGKKSFFSRISKIMGFELYALS